MKQTKVQIDVEALRASIDPPITSAEILAEVSAGRARQIDRTNAGADPNDIDATAFAVVQLPNDEHGRAVWAPVELKLEGGIVTGVKLVAMDTTDYQAAAYRYLAGAVMMHGSKVCQEYVRPRVCSHEAPTLLSVPHGARKTSICEACGAEQYGGHGPWFMPAAKAVANAG